MRRILLALAMLLAAAPLLPAQTTIDPFAPAQARPAGPAARPVAVDLLDFRQPIPDPLETIVAKYDDKFVRFTGTLIKWGKDEKQNPYYDLQAEVVHLPIGQPLTANPLANKRPPGKPQPGAPEEKLRKDNLVVRVYLKNDDPRLQNNRPGQLELTVEGKGQIQLGNWQLIIHEATIVSNKPSTPPRR